jgi:AraC family transcriptional regulator
MLMAGLRRQHACSNSFQTIPEQWLAFQKLGRLPGQVGTTAYGIICSGNPESIEYMCGVEVADFKGLPEELGRLRVAEQRYAVFWHAEPIWTIQKTWSAILGEWLPSSGFESAHKPDFELYDERFDPATGLGGLEIWISIVDKPS